MSRKSRPTENDHPAVHTLASRVEGAAGRMASAGAELPEPAEDVLAYAKQYARQRPEVVALWCLGLGFVLGWKLKIW